MTQDEIIEMAVQAGANKMVSCLTAPKGPITAIDFGLDNGSLEAFAKLVAAKATDEANARSNASWTLMCKKMVENEREACAKVAESFGKYESDLADAIRARSGDKE